MPHPKLVLMVKFRSTLPMDQALAIANERADEFRALPGLIQKYYLHDAATDEWAGLYLWESPEAFDAYRQSELRASIAAAYKAESEPKITVMKVVMPLRE